MEVEKKLYTEKLQGLSEPRGLLQRSLPSWIHKNKKAMCCRKRTWWELQSLVLLMLCPKFCELEAITKHR